MTPSTDSGTRVAATKDKTDAGLLYVVATPIGNLDDMSPRAVEVLRRVDLIAAEDTRHSARLLDHFGVPTRCLSLHEHNETRVAPQLVERIEAGESVALISDAGTPLVSDPGYPLVRAAVDAGLRVVAIPGPSAVTAALSISGLATDRFVFEGFLPAKAVARRRALAELADDSRTLVFYEAPHRLGETVSDMVAVFGDGRRVALARELSKRYEEVLYDDLGGLLRRLQGGSARRGEAVLVVAGAPPRQADEKWVRKVLDVLASELPASKAASLAARITGRKRQELYRRLTGDGRPPMDGG